MAHLITKRPFLEALNCPTAGWRRLREESTSMTPALEWRFWVGNEIQRAARQQLGEGPVLPWQPTDRGADETRSALTDSAAPLLFEATFIRDSYTARADALRRNAAGWDLIEFKSGKAPEDLKELKAEYLDDLAYTAFVAGASGVTFTRSILMLVNRDYRLGGAAPLMAELDLTESVRARAQEFADIAPEVAEALLGPLEPPAELRFVCRDCEYFRTSCIGVGIPDPLFDIPRLLAKRFEALKAYGRVSAIPATEKLTDNQERVARVIRNNCAEVDHDALTALRTARWPVYYLDFEGVGPALPWFTDVEPYEQIPFQYSLDRLDGPGTGAVHFEYLAGIEGDWRRELCHTLLDQLGDVGSIVVYSGYEKRVFNYLKRVVPEEQPRLESVIERLFDLEPIVRNGYCHPDFHGKSGIKYVLPVMVPTHSYEGLGVQGGDDASAVFALMRIGKYDGSATSKHRAHLLEYCGMDTTAMVKVHEALLALVSGKR